MSLPPEKARDPARRPPTQPARLAGAPAAAARAPRPDAQAKASQARRAPARRWLSFLVPLAFGLGIGTAGAAYTWLGGMPGQRQAAALPDRAAERPAAPRTGPMSHKVMLGLVRSTLGALGNAIETGNYTVLRDLGAPGFREANDTDRLAAVFAGQRNSRVDLTGIMFTDPVVTIEPRIEATGLMRVAGFFPAGTARYEFDLLYKPVEGRWRLFGISTGIARTEPAAQAALPPPGRLSEADTGSVSP